MLRKCLESDEVKTKEWRRPGIQSPAVYFIEKGSSLRLTLSQSWINQQCEIRIIGLFFQFPAYLAAWAQRAVKIFKMNRKVEIWERPLTADKPALCIDVRMRDVRYHESWDEMTKAKWKRRKKRWTSNIEWNSKGWQRRLLRPLSSKRVKGITYYNY